MFVIDLRNSTQRSYMFSVMGNKNVDKVYIYSRFTQYADKHIYVKVLGENFADKIRIDSEDIEVKDGCLIVKWLMGEVVTCDKKIQIQLQFEDVTNDLIDQSMIASITLANTLPVSEIIPPPAPSVVQQILNDISQLQGHDVADVDVGFENGTLTITLLNIEEEEIGSVQVELPTEECYVGATWNVDNNHKIILTKNSGQTTELDLSDVFTAIEGVSTALTNHKNSKSNPHEVTKQQVGLGNVDNTSDQDKPVSTAQQQALNGKVDKVNTNNKAYGTDGSGNQTSYSLDNGTGYSGNVARRDSNGQLHVPQTPTANDHATSKIYADSFGKTLEVSINSSTYVMTFTLKDANGNTLATQSVDLPLETMVVSGSYDSVNKAIILTLDNGQTISIPVADLVSGLVSNTELATILTGYYTKVQTDNLLAKKVNYYDVGDLWFDELESDFVGNLNAGDVVNAQEITGVVITASQYEKVILYFEYDTDNVYKIFYYFNQDENIWEYDYETQNCLMPNPNYIDDNYILRKENGGWSQSTAPRILEYNDLTTITSSEIASWQVGDIIIYFGVIFYVRYVAQNRKTICGADINGLIGKANKYYTYSYNKNNDSWYYASNDSIDVGDDFMVEIEWADLKALRDNGQLKKGQQYKITDYQCSTGQRNTRAMNNPFDIIVTADSEKTLNENARACLREKIGIYSDSMGWWFYRCQEEDGYYDGNYYYAFSHYDSDEDRYYYIYTLSLFDKPQATNCFLFKGYNFSFISIHDSEVSSIYTLDEEGESIDDDTFHFATSKLEAWKIKYCLDNDVDRFYWVNRAIKVLYGTETYIYVRYPSGDNSSGIAFAYIENSESKNFDEVDFDNIDSSDIIIMEGYDEEGEYEPIGTELDMGGDGVRLIEYYGLGTGVIYYMKDEFGNECPYDFKNIQFYNDDESEHFYTFSFYYDDTGEVIDASIFGNTELLLNDSNCSSGVTENVIKEYVVRYPKFSLIKLNEIYFISKESFSGGEFYGINGNKFDNDCYQIVFGSNCSYNQFGISCSNDIFGDRCGNNYFIKDCSDITFSTSCSHNVFGSACSNITFEDHCCNNQFGDNCYSIYFVAFCEKIVLGNECFHITFESDVNRNITIGAGANYITFMAGYCRSIVVESSCSYIDIKSSDTNASSTNWLQNVKVHMSIKGTGSNHKEIDTDRALAYSVDYYATNSIEVFVD